MKLIQLILSILMVHMVINGQTNNLNSILKPERYKTQVMNAVFTSEMTVKLMNDIDNIPDNALSEFSYTGYKPQNPIFIVDGIEMNTALVNKINIKEIQKVTVYKGTSATNIFGTKGANGVIIIKTKKKAGNQVGSPSEGDRLSPKRKNLPPDL